METKIKFNNINLFAFHGATKEEKILGQNFQIDAEIVFNKSSNNSDSLSSTIDYSIIYNDIKNVVLKKKYNLIEYLANQIINKLFNRYELLYCKINIRKPNAPINGQFESVEVELERDVRRK